MVGGEEKGIGDYVMGFLRKAPEGGGSRREKLTGAGGCSLTNPYYVFVYFRFFGFIVTREKAPPITLTRGIRLWFLRKNPAGGGEG